MNDEKENHTSISSDNNEITNSDTAKIDLQEVKENIEIVKELEEKELAILEASMWRGPLPPPSLLEEYNEVVPGLAERIIQMTEKEGDHRRKIETTIVNNAGDEKKRGQRFGFFISLFALSVSGVTAYFGSEVVASIIGGTTVGSLAAVFITGRFTSQKEEARQQHEDDQ